MTKEALRSNYKQKTSTISPQQKSKWVDLLLINFQKINLPFISCVQTYLAMDDRNEINTSQIIQYLEFRNPGLKVAIPRINIKTCEIENYIHTKNMEMALHKFGMEEPFA